MDSTASETEAIDLQEEDVDTAVSSEFYSLSHRSLPLQPSSAPFSDVDESSERHAPPSGSESGTESPEMSSVEAQNPTPESDMVGHVLEAGFQPLRQPQLLPGDQKDMLSNPNIPIIATTLEDQQALLSPSPDTYTSYRGQSSFHPLHDPFTSDFATDGLHGLPSFDTEIKRSDSFRSQASFMTPSTDAFGIDMMGHAQVENDSSRRQSEASGFSSFDSLSPDMIPQLSPSPHQQGLAQDPTSPNPSIASRRKIRPPQRLNQTALRNYPNANGPKTGVEGPRRTEMYGAMRRAASANGPLSGKIFKSCPPVSPLSPRSFDPNLLEQFARASSMTSTSNAFRDTSDASPAKSNFEQQYLSAEAPRLGLQRSSMSNNSLGENAAAAASPSTSDFAQDVAFSGVPTQGFQSFQHPSFTLDTSYGPSSEEALTTPGLSQFGSEVEFPMSLSAPKYVESEPATPSYVPGAVRGTSAMQTQAFPAFKLESPPQSDIFPWSRSPDQQLPMWKSSLGQLSETQSQSFQFQPNITPQNFNSPGRG